MTILKHLHIQNIVLIDKVDIPFEPGFNVLSGETGSGKSAIMGALNLIAGERADAGMIRRGEDKGVVEALFEIDALPEAKKLLDDAGIDMDEGNSVIIRREISTSGKGRVFINHQSAQVSLLKRLGDLLLNSVGQHANQRLLSIEHHRKLVDLFGSLETLAGQFAAGWTRELELRRELEEWIQQESQRLRELEVCRMELEELESANLQDNEEEETFSEYTLLANAEELSQKISEITNGLNAEGKGVLAILSRQRSNFDYAARLAPALAEASTAYQNAQMELQEIAYILSRFLSAIEINPQRMHQMEERLALINRLKRKYGATVAAISAYTEKTRQRLQILESSDERSEELRQQLQDIEGVNNLLAAKLTQKRKEASLKLAKAVVEQLHSLNMPNVVFEADISVQPRARSGDDRIEFFLVPNVGEHRIAVRDCASGGELSRLMLGLQTLLAGKEMIPTVIFDEIDANIGGATATIVGDKMRAIGQKHQVICITHFPQVAKHADHHIQIFKSERHGRTLTEVVVLDEKTRDKELARMAGVST